MLAWSSRDLAVLAYCRCTSTEVGAEEGRDACREESSAPLCSSSTCTGNPGAVNLKSTPFHTLNKRKKGSRTVLTTVKGWLGGSLSSCFYENYNFHLSLPRKRTKKNTKKHRRQAIEKNPPLPVNPSRRTTDACAATRQRKTVCYGFWKMVKLLSFFFLREIADIFILLATQIEIEISLCGCRSFARPHIFFPNEHNYKCLCHVHRHTKFGNRMVLTSGSLSSTAQLSWECHFACSHYSYACFSSAPTLEYSIWHMPKMDRRREPSCQYQRHDIINFTGKKRLNPDVTLLNPLPDLCFLPTSLQTTLSPLFAASCKTTQYQLTTDKLIYFPHLVQWTLVTSRSLTDCGNTSKWSFLLYNNTFHCCHSF